MENFLKFLESVEKKKKKKGRIRIRGDGTNNEIDEKEGKLIHGHLEY